jgi:hypothetical protein
MHNAGGEIVKGSIVATVDEDGALDMRYQHVNTAGDLMVRIYLSALVADAADSGSSPPPRGHLH